MYPLKRAVYERSPDFVKAAVSSVPFSWLAGRSYRRVIARGKRIERAARTELLAYQERELGKVLQYATETIPAYYGLRSVVGRLRPFEALKAFPLINKESLQANYERYLPQGASAPASYETTTGGTSGNQLTFRLDDDSQAVETAFIHRLWSRVGYTPNCRKATFRGVEIGSLPPGRYWRANPIYNERQFSPYHLSDSTFPDYMRGLREWKPRFLHGYPSAISLIARFVLSSSDALGPLSIRAALLGSEGTLPEQRAMIIKAFGTRVFTWYGHSERLILAGECEYASEYHHFPDYGVLEMLSPTGQPVEEGEFGEIVGTGLLNRSMPLIRYRTEDMARKLPAGCSCGRQFDRFDNVQGRWQQEYVVGHSGALISTTCLNMHGDLFARVIQYQYFQESRGELELRVVCTPEFGISDENALREAYRRRVGAELDLRIKRVAAVALTSRGKWRRLVQLLPPASGDRVELSGSLKHHESEAEA